MDAEQLTCTLEAVRIIAKMVKAWPDEKLTKVRDFCAAGKMDFTNPCCCLAGVASSDKLHTYCGRAVMGDFSGHYWRFRVKHPEVELAYSTLGSPGFLESPDIQQRRDQRFLEILDAEINRRTSSILATSEQQEVTQKVTPMESPFGLRATPGRSRLEGLNRGESPRLNDDEESEPLPFPDWMETKA